MSNYIDGYVFPIARKDLETYRVIAEKIAEIWKEHGALGYYETVSDEMQMEGTLSFTEVLAAEKEEVIVFGWISFVSRETRDLAHQRLAADDRMAELVAPLMNPDRIIFDASKMVFGGFKSLVG